MADEKDPVIENDGAVRKTGNKNRNTGAKTVRRSSRTAKNGEKDIKYNDIYDSRNSDGNLSGNAVGNPNRGKKGKPANNKSKSAGGNRRPRSTKKPVPVIKPDDKVLDEVQVKDLEINIINTADVELKSQETVESPQEEGYYFDEPEPAGQTYEEAKDPYYDEPEPEFNGSDGQYYDEPADDTGAISSAESDYNNRKAGNPKKKKRKHLPEEEGRIPKKRKKRKKSRRQSDLFVGIALIVLLAGVGIYAGYLHVLNYSVKPEITVEAGTECPDVSEFLNWDLGDHASLSGACAVGTLDEIGDYGVVVQVFGQKKASVIHVQDTMQPLFTTKNVTTEIGTPVKPEEFIEEITDFSETTIRFKEEPDFNSIGTFNVVIEAEDESGNVGEAGAVLEVVSTDTIPPEIHGVKEITVEVGGSVSYKKGVTVTDNQDENVELKVNASQVDTNTVGDYEVVYFAADQAGNETSATAIVHVVGKEETTDEKVNAEADAILESITDPSMSKYEVAKAIYWWCHEKIAFVDGTPKTSPAAGAYQGLVERKGDCYTYAMSAKYLLTRAGITNMDIERIRVGDSMHYWNVIDIGEGWHHFDTCRRRDGSTFFYLTDAELMAYSDTHNGTHNYDRSLYPPIP